MPQRFLIKESTHSFFLSNKQCNERFFFHVAVLQRQNGNYGSNWVSNETLDYKTIIKIE